MQHLRGSVPSPPPRRASSFEDTVSDAVCGCWGKAEEAFLLARPRRMGQQTGHAFWRRPDFARWAGGEEGPRVEFLQVFGRRDRPLPLPGSLRCSVLPLLSLSLLPSFPLCRLVASLPVLPHSTFAVNFSRLRGSSSLLFPPRRPPLGNTLSPAPLPDEHPPFRLPSPSFPPPCLTDSSKQQSPPPSSRTPTTSTSRTLEEPADARRRASSSAKRARRTLDLACATSARRERRHLVLRLPVLSLRPVARR